MNVTFRLMDGALSGICETGNILDPAAAYVGLYITGPTTTPPATVADFTLPDATDVPAQVLTSWSATQHLTDGRSAKATPAKTFVLPDSTNAFSAGGYYLADAITAGNILGWEAFPSPIPMPDQFHPVTLIVRFTVDPAGNWSATIVIDG